MRKREKVAGIIHDLEPDDFVQGITGTQKIVEKVTHKRKVSLLFVYTTIYRVFKFPR